MIVKMTVNGMLAQSKRIGNFLSDIFKIKLIMMNKVRLIVRKPSSLLSVRSRGTDLCCVDAVGQEGFRILREDRQKCEQTGSELCVHTHTHTSAAWAVVGLHAIWNIYRLGSDNTHSIHS